MAGISAAALFKAFSTGDYADFTILCGQNEFKVHKVIICADSHYFQSVCKGNFKEQESVDLKEQDPDIVGKVLHFLYFGDYHKDNQQCNAEFHRFAHPPAPLYDSEPRKPQFKSLEDRPISDRDLSALGEMHTIAKVYQTGDMLGIESLKFVTTRKILNIIATEANARILEEALETIFSIVPNGGLLRDAVTDACAHNYKQVMLLPKAVALLEEHETRIWRLARQTYTAHTEKIVDYVRKAIESTCKERQCINPSCKSTDVVLDQRGLKSYSDGSLSARIKCLNCGKVTGVDLKS